MKIMHSIRFLKFLAVGGFGALSYILVSYLITTQGVRPWLASIVTYSCLIPLIYTLQRKLVFNSNEKHRKSFPKYLSVQLLGIGLSASLPLLLERYAISPLMSFVAVAASVAVISYALQSLWIFSSISSSKKC